MRVLRLQFFACLRCKLDQRAPSRHSLRDAADAMGHRKPCCRPYTRIGCSLAFPPRHRSSQMLVVPAASTVRRAKQGLAAIQHVCGELCQPPFDAVHAVHSCFLVQTSHHIQFVLPQSLSLQLSNASVCEVDSPAPPGLHRTNCQMDRERASALAALLMKTTAAWHRQPKVPLNA